MVFGGSLAINNFDDLKHFLNAGKKRYIHMLMT